jgi:uncharacterized protein (TIGR00251 family)
VAGSHSSVFNAISDRAEGAVVSIYASPRSGKNEIGPVDGGELRVRITAAAVDGAANSALIKYLSDLLRLPRSQIEILSGKTSRHKRVLFRGISSTQLIVLLGLDPGLVAPE